MLEVSVEKLGKQHRKFFRKREDVDKWLLLEQQRTWDEGKALIAQCLKDEEVSTLIPNPKP